MAEPGILDELLDTLPGASSFPWATLADERPELIALVQALIAHGLLATAAAAELRQRGWVCDGAPDLEGRLAAAIDRRFVRGRRRVGPYAPLVAVPLGGCPEAAGCPACEGVRR